MGYPISVLDMGTNWHIGSLLIINEIMRYKIYFIDKKLPFTDSFFTVSSMVTTVGSYSSGPGGGGNIGSGGRPGGW